VLSTKGLQAAARDTVRGVINDYKKKKKEIMML
jgi:type IV pilus biogenesis protein CpaD/CtpE